MSTVNVIERVEAAMRSDDEDTEDQSERLVEAYQRATPEARAVVDEIFACLCGWELKTILAGRDDNDGENWEEGAE